MKTTKTTWVCVASEYTDTTGVHEEQQWVKAVLRPYRDGAAWVPLIDGTSVYNFFDSVVVMFKELPKWEHNTQRVWKGIYFPASALSAVGLGRSGWYGFASGEDNTLGTKYNGFYRCVVNTLTSAAGTGEPIAPHPTDVTRLEIAEDSLRNTLSMMLNVINK